MRCRRCNNEKNGFYNGKQRYKCKRCRNYQFLGQIANREKPQVLKKLGFL